MSVCVCIASRGRPQELKQTIEQTLSLATVASTHISVALDNDDASAYAGSYCRAEVLYSFGEREHSLGAKYNRAAGGAHKDATVFVLGIDDAYMNVMGWDQKLLDAASLFEDGVGVIYSGPKSGMAQLPEGYALTKGWIEKVGFFCPPYFPFWWHDTWIDELARMTGRYVWVDIPWNKHGSSEGKTHKTTRMREVAWWAKFFDDTRPQRVETAKRMIAESNDPAWRESQLLSEMPTLCEYLELRNTGVRNNAAYYERNYGAEVGVDPGYEILKEQAARMTASRSNG